MWKIFFFKKDFRFLHNFFAVLKKYDSFLLYTAVVVASALIFCAIYGVHVLNPTYVDWCMSGGDLPQHYLGWCSFRNSPWMFPIGMTRELTYPIETSVIFTDSILLLAVPCKLFSFLLPSQFQYFGVWGISCFILQGLVSARILEKILSDKMQVFFGSLIFVLSPIMIWRMYFHTSLAGQWILLLSLYAFLNPPEQIKNECVLWAMVGFLSSVIHIYFVAMNFFVLFACCIKKIFSSENLCVALKKSLFQVSSFFILALFSVFLLGGFSTTTASASYDLLGEASMNMNAFFNPQGWSCFFRDLPMYSFWQIEGFAYLGAGVLLLFVLAVCNLVLSGKIKNISNRWKNWLPMTVLFLVAVLFAMSNVVTFGKSELVRVSLPGRIEKAWSIFRSTGRFSWISVYIIIITTFKCLAGFPGKHFAFIFAVSLVFQGYDLHSCLAEKRQEYNRIKKYSSVLLENNVWESISTDSNIRHLYFCNNFLQSDMYAIANMVLKTKKTMNRFCIAHERGEAFDDEFKKAVADSQNDSVYIFNADNCIFPALYNLHYYLAGNYLLGFVSPRAGLEEEVISPVWCYKFGDGRNVRDGRDEDGKRIIHANGLSYGPYVSLPAGYYSVEIKGSGLLNTGIDVYSEFGADKSHRFTVEKSDVFIRIHITLTTDVNNLEILISNLSDCDIILDSFEIHRVTKSGTE